MKDWISINEPVYPGQVEPSNVWDREGDLLKLSVCERMPQSFNLIRNGVIFIKSNRHEHVWEGRVNDDRPQRFQLNIPMDHSR